jgi:hypothetical protein
VLTGECCFALSLNLRVEAAYYDILEATNKLRCLDLALRESARFRIFFCFVVGL